jgi:excisionase family DNA binding protein
VTTLLTIPKLAQLTGLSYRLCLQLVEAGEIPSVPVGSRRRIDIRWVEQWLESGGFRSKDTAAKTADPLSTNS